MAPSSGHDGTPRHKRKSLFTLSSLTNIHSASSASSASVAASDERKLQKKRGPSVPSIPPLDTSVEEREHVGGPNSAGPASYRARRSSASQRPMISRPASVFGSLKSLRSHADEDKAHYYAAAVDVNFASSRNVIYHGEVQTSSSVFRKKKEYLVLTETHIVRCKSHARAVESFPTIQQSHGRSPTIRHTSSQSIGSAHDAMSFGSDSSGDKDGRTPLRHIVSVHTHEDSKPSFAIEVCALDEEHNQASAMTLQFARPEERDRWLQCIRSTTTNMMRQEQSATGPYNLSYAARTVEREGDYDPARFHLYKIVQRHPSKASGRSSTDDMSKIASVVCFLAIGIHKVHIIPLPKPISRTSAVALNQTVHGSYGILTLNAIETNAYDDQLQITFRQPSKRPNTLHLASLAVTDIALRLHYAEHYLRPECAHWLYKFQVPPELEAQADIPIDSTEEEHSCLDRTLTAYCIAYDINPAKIRYTIDYDCEDAPRFELLPSADPRRPAYSAYELLAVLRALRYNETFASMSFQDICLDSLHGLYDPYGVEYVCVRTKRGTPLRIPPSQLSKASLLIQEVRAIASTTKKLRRLVFSRCVTIQPAEGSDDQYRPQNSGCGIVEALLPLCQHQTTNVDWITLNGIILGESDLDYLVGAAVDRNCHFRALELSKCGLGDRTLGLVLDALRAHDNTLEALNIAGNLARLSPAVFDGQIGVFGFIRFLDISNLPRTSGPEPLISADTLLTWRLETLKLSGINMNERSVDALAIYLRSPKSQTLKELMLDNAFLNGRDIAKLMQALHTKPGQGRALHLDISHNKIYRDYDQLCNAFEAGFSPTHVTLRAMEYRDENVLKGLLKALRKNHTTKYLDISRASLPGDASDDTSSALARLFAENDTLEEIDISGEDSRLETSKFGGGLNSALEGLHHNKTLRVLRIQYQKLGIVGANILAEVLKENTTLRELHCDHNEIPLSAFTELVNALHKNTTLIFLPAMDEGRARALKQTEKQVKLLRDEGNISQPTTSPAKANLGKRGLANVKKHTSRTASAATPSFPLLAPSRDRSASSPQSSSTKASTAQLPQLSEQDILAALRLVAESWDRQQYRLQQYLQRNWYILQGVSVPMDIEEEDFERPNSMASLSNVLEKVKMDATPRVELDEPNLFAAAQAAGQLDDLEERTRSSTTGSVRTIESHHSNPDGKLTSKPERPSKGNTMDGLVLKGHTNSSPATVRNVGGPNLSTPPNRSSPQHSSSSSSISSPHAPQLFIPSIDNSSYSYPSSTFVSLADLQGRGDVSPISEVNSPLSRWGSGTDSIAEEDEDDGGVSPIAEDEEPLEIAGLGIRSGGGPVGKSWA